MVAFMSQVLSKEYFDEYSVNDSTTGRNSSSGFSNKTLGSRLGSEGTSRSMSAKGGGPKLPELK